MNNKFILENISTGEKTNFKTMRNISAFYVLIIIKQVVYIFFYTKGKKHLHNITKSLSEKYEIIDESDYLNF